MLSLGAPVSIQFVGQTDTLGNVSPQDRTSPFKRLGHRSHSQLAILDIDHNGITRHNPKLTTHQGWYHQLSTFYDFNPLRIHRAYPCCLTCSVHGYQFW
jgi:hypothetical protein